MEGRLIFDTEQTVEEAIPKKAEFTRTDAIKMPQNFKALNRVVMRDLNRRVDTPLFRKYTKEQILEFLTNPYKYQNYLIDACINMYGVSTNFRRFIDYFTMLNDFSYVVTPFGIDLRKAKEKSIRNNFNKVTKRIESFQVKSQLPKILKVCLREDVFFGTIRETADSVTIQRLPSKYCKISVIEGNVFNVTFDFTYFSVYPERLQYYPEEFAIKYELSKGMLHTNRWIELDSPNSFAIKCSSDIGEYIIPPFAGILPEIYDLEDYKAIKLTKTELENYAILLMKLGLNNDGSWQIDLDKAMEFWSNLEGELPDAVGTILSPLPIEKISFERPSGAESNAVADAAEELFNSVGVSSLLFNSNKSSSNALLLSIKADQGVTYGIVKSIGDMINRYIQNTNYGKNFKVTFLDTSPFNRDEVGAQYLKMCQFGMPMVSYLASTYGMPQCDMDNLNFLEDVILDVKNRFIPLMSSNMMSSSDAQGEAGRPESGLGEISDNGELAKDQDEGY